MKDLVGKKFSRWTVTKYSHQIGPHHYWACLCRCGNKRTVQQGSLGVRSFSCGCLRKQSVSKAQTTHGMSKTKLNRVWAQMIQRCINPNSDRYSFYGARGIKVCKRWRKFENFLSDMGPTYKPSLSIDRIDNDGDYKPSNCRWTTPRVQARNRRNAHLTNSPWGRICLSEAAEKSGLCRKTIYDRIKRGLTGDALWQTWYPQNN